MKVVELPALAENIESASVLSILVSVGDHVEVDQVLIEFETDKATVELPAPCSGRVVTIRVSEGDDVPVGTPLMEIEESDVRGDAPGPTSEEPTGPSSSEATEPAPIPAPKSKPTPSAASLEARATPGPPLAAAPSRSGSGIPASPFVRRLARELGITPRELIDRCRAEGFFVQNGITKAKIELERRIRGWYKSEDSASAE